MFPQIIFSNFSWSAECFRKTLSGVKEAWQDYPEQNGIHFIKEFLLKRKFYNFSYGPFLKFISCSFRKLIFIFDPNISCCTSKLLFYLFYFILFYLGLPGWKMPIWAPRPRLQVGTQVFCPQVTFSMRTRPAHLPITLFLLSGGDGSGCIMEQRGMPGLMLRAGFLFLWLIFRS